MMRGWLASGLLALLVAGGAGAQALTSPMVTGSGDGDWVWVLPPDFPMPRVPPDNPMSTSKVELGRQLFYDRRLSGSGRIRCASCHVQARAFSDGRVLSPGGTGQRTHRNAQHLPNVAWHATYTWANPALVSLERQMLVPLFGDDPVEMGVNDANKEVILERFRKELAYANRFRQAFPGEPTPMNWTNVVKAIASFQRSLVSGHSRYDQYARGELRLKPNEARGMALFFGEKAECFHCHSGFNFNDQVVHRLSREVETPFHNTGLYNIDGRGGYPEPSRGIHDITGQPEDMGRFRAPSLRNVAVTGPYMHDGSLPSLAAVVRTYAAGGRHVRFGLHAGDGRRNPFKSELIGRIELTRTEQADLVAFLKTLTDEDFLRDARYADPAVSGQGAFSGAAPARSAPASRRATPSSRPRATIP